MKTAGLDVAREKLISVKSGCNNESVLFGRKVAVSQLCKRERERGRMKLE